MSLETVLRVLTMPCRCVVFRKIFLPLLAVLFEWFVASLLIWCRSLPYARLRVLSNYWKKLPQCLIYTRVEELAEWFDAEHNLDLRYSVRLRQLLKMLTSVCDLRSPDGKHFPRLGHLRSGKSAKQVVWICRCRSCWLRFGWVPPYVLNLNQYRCLD